MFPLTTRFRFASYLYHFSVGLLSALVWLRLASPDLSCWGPANTTEYWTGLLLLVLGLVVRTAHTFQRLVTASQPEPDRFLPFWWTAIRGYLLEAVLAGLTALLLAFQGGPDTTGRWSAAELFPELLLLALLSLALAPLCGSLLGWKLAGSPLPAALPPMVGAYLFFLSIPPFLGAHQELLPDAFPLLPVLSGVLLGLGFLVVSARLPGPWLQQSARPHPGLLVACLVPVVGVVGSWANDFGVWDFPWVLLVALASLPAVSPVYLATWTLLRPPASTAQLMAWSFLVGAAAQLCVQQAHSTLPLLEVGLNPALRFPVSASEVGVLSAVAAWLGFRQSNDAASN